ncbi:MAG: excinuclease ABC subunit UvrA [Candidatus Paceibacterota bacterium]|jgi:excinuclease ABC subunit A
MERDFIELTKVKVNNLKNISLKIPKNKLVVICGTSGSGKSSLAFDTIFQEGQRRYLESLSSYARQFLGGMKKPDVEKIEGLSPTVAVDQKTVSSNPRSIVGTLTEIYDYLRLLFAYVGSAYCPKCGRPLASQTPHQIADHLYGLAEKGWVSIFAPVVIGKKGEHKGTIEEIWQEGWPQVRIDGIAYPISEAREKNFDKNKSHDIDILVDRVSLAEFQKNIAGDKKLSKKEKEALSLRKKRVESLIKETKERILESVKKGLKIGKGRIVISWIEKKKVREEILSMTLTCPICQISFPEIEPRLFSFNSPFGACGLCQGLGKLLKVEPNLILNPELSLNEGAILPWFALGRFVLRSLGVSSQQYSLEEAAGSLGFSLDKPFGQLPEDIQKIILYGDPDLLPDYEGAIPKLERVYHETESDYVRGEISKYMREILCPDCQGARLKTEALSVRLADKNISQVTLMPVGEARQFFKELSKGLGEGEKIIAEPLVNEICKRISFLVDVGVDYISLSRDAESLSIGENQRIRLACQLGSGLSGIIYVLDEPTIGLHQRDTDRLIKALKDLVKIDNTVIVVDHDDMVIAAADWIIEIGPGSGKFGGEVVFEGTYPELLKSRSLTGRYLSGDLSTSTGFIKNSVSDARWLQLKGASEFTLKNVDLKIPLGRFVSVGGVSGSGKSTLIIDTLSKILGRAVNGVKKSFPGKYEEITGLQNIDKVVLADQSPIGRTPRSNPATYTGIFNPIREIFAQTYQARLKGWGPSYFSFNTKSGRCPACKGEGSKKVEMYFLPDVYVECDICKGRKFTPEVLKAEYNSKNIADILDMSIDEAKAFFASIPQIKDKLQLLSDIGLGYLKLGQSATALSGGEAQRIKLAYELARRGTGRTMYILDEPTVGLHFDDVKKLLIILRRLVEKGNTVLIIEHNLDVLKESDWIIELGPEGGAKGGKIIFEGTLSDLKKSTTPTAKFL